MFACVFERREKNIERWKDLNLKGTKCPCINNDWKKYKYKTFKKYLFFSYVTLINILTYTISTFIKLVWFIDFCTLCRSILYTAEIGLLRSISSTFYASFFCRYPFTKKSQSRTAIREKIQNLVFVQKFEHEMLMKLNP